MLARRLRPALLAVVTGAIVLTVVLGFRYAGQVTPGRLDRQLDGLAHWTLDIPVWGYIDVYFHQMGDHPNAVALVFAVALAAGLVRGPAGVALALVGVGAAVALTELVIAPLVGRYHGADLSYPSGHVTAVSALAAVVVVVLVGRARITGIRLLGSLIAVGIAAASSLAVVAEETHYSTDAAAGWCVAVATVLSTAMVIDALIADPR